MFRRSIANAKCLRCWSRTAAFEYSGCNLKPYRKRTYSTQANPVGNLPSGNEDAELGPNKSVEQGQWSIFKSAGEGYNGESVTLDIGALGQPAQIRILRDPTRKRPRTLQAHENKKPDTTSLSREFLELVAIEEGSSNGGTVEGNIEQIRRSFIGGDVDSSPPLLSGCRDAAQQLHDGFTVAQLSSYVSKAFATKGVQIDDLQDVYRSRYLKRSMWFHGKSSFPESAVQRLSLKVVPNQDDSLLLGLTPKKNRKKLTKKQHLVVTILRKCWRIRAAEERLLEGELDVQLQPEHLNLLLNHRTENFKSLSENFGARIEISPSNFVVRITGDYQTCLSLSRAMERTASNIRCDIIPLVFFSTPSSQAVDLRSIILGAVEDDVSYLKRVEKLTDTLIIPQLSLRNNEVIKLNVYYIGPSAKDLDNVRLLTLQLIDSRGPQIDEVRCLPSPEFIWPTQIPIEVKEELSWSEQLRDWSRWRLKPLHKRSHQQENPYGEDPTLPDNSATLARIRGFLTKRWSEVGHCVQENNTSPYWKPALHRSISATFGYIIYSTRNNNSTQLSSQNTTNSPSLAQSSQLVSTFQQAMQSYRSIMTSLPELLQLQASLVSRDLIMQNGFSIKLRPHAVGGTQTIAIENLPDLEIFIEDDGKIQSNKRVKARLIYDHRQSDLLLLDNMCDLRFNGTISMESNANVDSSITEFVGNNYLDTWDRWDSFSSSRLRIFVPWIASHSTGSSQLPGTSPGNTGLVEVEYRFSKLEQCSNLSAEYKGLLLHYTQIDAGKFGGRREEMKLVNSILANQNTQAPGSAFGLLFAATRDIVSRFSRNVKK